MPARGRLPVGARWHAGTAGGLLGKENASGAGQTALSRNEQHHHYKYDDHARKSSASHKTLANAVAMRCISPTDAVTSKGLHPQICR
jgi:hypothetical protein